MPYFTIICSLRKKYKEYFNDLVNCFLGQTFQDYECLFIIDESDSSWVRCPDNRFRILQLDIERGLSVKRNIGISNSNGKYVVFCDADDFFAPTLLYSFWEVSQKFNADFIIPKVTRQADMLNKDNHLVDSSHFYCEKENVIDIFFSRYTLSGSDYEKEGFILDGCWGRAFKKSILDDNQIRFYEEPCRAEDALFENDYAYHCNNVYLMSNYFGYFWRENNSSEMFNIQSFFFNINPFINRLINQLNMVDVKYSKYLNNYLGNLIFGQFNTFCLSYLNKKAKKKMVVLKVKEMFSKNSLCRSVIKDKSVMNSKSRRIISFFINHGMYQASVTVGIIIAKKNVKRIKKGDR